MKNKLADSHIQRDKQTDTQTDKKTDAQTDRRTDRQTNIQTNPLIRHKFLDFIDFCTF